MTRIRLRRSTIALTAFFAPTLAAYLVLRPAPPGPRAGTGHQHQPGPGGPVVIHPAYPGAVELLPAPARKTRTATPSPTPTTSAPAASASPTATPHPRHGGQRGP